MEASIEIHSYKDIMDKQLAKLEEFETTKKNKKLILDFKDHCLRSSIGYPRILKYLNELKIVARQLNKDFDKATKKDLEAIITWLSQSHYAEESRRDVKVAIKKFYRWLEAERQGKDASQVKQCDLIDWITLKMGKTKKIRNEDLLTEDEILRIISACSNTRDQAIIAVLAESGCRISELGNMHIKNVRFDDNGAILSISGKTGERSIRIVSSAKYLKQWINVHPLNKDENAPLWCNKLRPNEPIYYNDFVYALKMAKTKAKITKRMNPHLFRHTRATILAGLLPESLFKAYMGWSQSSDMAARYVHLNNATVDEAILGLHGKGAKRKTLEESKLNNISCSRCGEANPVTHVRCSKCNSPLTIEEALKEDHNKALKEAEILAQLSLLSEQVKRLESKN